MSSTKIHSIVRSFIIVPLVATTISMDSFMNAIDTAVNQPVEQQIVVSQEELQLQKEREEKAAKIDAYYAKYNMPLEGYGMKMVLEAEEHDLDWRLLPAIAVRESTGGKYACYNGPFGYGSCKIKFQSFSHAIEVVAMNLGCDNPKKSRCYYEGKSLRGILQTYNPPSVVPTYADEVIAIMNKIEKTTI